MGRIALILVAGLVALVLLYPSKVKSWGQSIEEAASSSISP